MVPQRKIDLAPDGRQSDAASAIQRGACRLLLDTGYRPLTEFTLASGRRADITAIGRKGEIWIVEVKSCIADFRADAKWPEYMDFCDRFFFATSPDVSRDVFPDDSGLIVADKFGAEIIQQASRDPLSAARRKAVTLRFARTAAARLHGLADPPPERLF